MKLNQVRGYDITTYQGYVKILNNPYPPLHHKKIFLPHILPLSRSVLITFIFHISFTLTIQRKKMKYGQHLRENIAPEYGPEPYLNYAHLDGIIRILSGKDLSR